MNKCRNRLWLPIWYSLLIPILFPLRQTALGAWNSLPGAMIERVTARGVTGKLSMASIFRVSKIKDSALHARPDL